MILRVAGLIGTASPRPTPATALFTPPTRARPPASAPHGEVGQRVRADDLELELARVGERGAAAAVAGRDHVGRGEHEAVRGDHDAAAAAVAHAPAADAAGDAQAGDRGSELLGDAR